MFLILQHAKHAIATTSNIASKTHPTTSRKTLNHNLINRIKRFMYAISRKVNRIEIKEKETKGEETKENKRREKTPFFLTPCVGVK
jgi:hypothetical protein